MNVNYSPEMGFTSQGRLAIKQDLSDFYHVTSVKLSNNPSPAVTSWVKGFRTRIIVALQSLIDAEAGDLDENKIQALKDLCTSLHYSYSRTYFLEDLDTRSGYQEHNESFLKKFK